MVFVDSNIPMYIVGAPHPNKAAAERLLRRAVEREEHLATDAEVLREILQRYHAIGRHDAIGPAFEVLNATVDSVFPVTAEDVNEARGILATHSGLSARDAVHAAIMNRHEISEILTFDAGFDAIPGIRRST